MIVAELIPPRIRRALDNHTCGHPTGGFVRAVLENNLCEAVCRADDECLAALPAIVRYVNELPSDCHGSADHVAAWLDKDL